MEALLSASSLRKTFGDFVAVKHVDLEVFPGECLALLGPNGAGKTTTVEMLEGLQTPDAGSIRIFGSELASHRRHILEEVGVMLQDTQLYKKLSVRETVSLFASFFKKAIDVGEAIKMVQLEDKTDQRLEALSGGQKQRAYLACALVNAPRLLFLDEPTTGLDPQARRMIWSLLEQHKKKDRGILLTTHYMDEAEQLADRIAVIDHGEIIARGTPQSLIEEHCGQQMLGFRFTRQLSEQELASLNQELSWFNHTFSSNDEYEASIDDPLAAIEQLQAAASRLSIKLDKVNMRRSTLEDVFLKLTGRSIRDA